MEGRNSRVVVDMAIAIYNRDQSVLIVQGTSAARRNGPGRKAERMKVDRGEWLVAYQYRDG